MYIKVFPLTMFCSGTSPDDDDLPVVDPKFVAFLRATLAQMAGTEILDPEIIDLEFWASWPRRFYNIRNYDGTKEMVEEKKKADRNSFVLHNLQHSESLPAEERGRGEQQEEEPPSISSPSTGATAAPTTAASVASTKAVGETTSKTGAAIQSSKRKVFTIK